MRYTSKTTVKAELLYKDKCIPVLVDASRVVSLRDRRGHFEGRLWAIGDFGLDILERKPLPLIFPSGDVETIKLLDRSIDCTPDGQIIFEAFFMSEKNIRALDYRIKE